MVRCREHLGTNKKGNSVKSASSAIRDHIKDTGQSTFLDNFCIIDRTNDQLDLLIHESLLTLRDRPTLNFQSSSIPFVYFSFIRLLVTYSLLMLVVACLP